MRSPVKLVRNLSLIFKDVQERSVQLWNSDRPRHALDWLASQLKEGTLVPRAGMPQAKSARLAVLTTSRSPENGLDTELLVTLDQWVTNMLQPTSGIETRIYRLFLLRVELYINCHWRANVERSQVPCKIFERGPLWQYKR